MSKDYNIKYYRTLDCNAILVMRVPIKYSMKNIQFYASILFCKCVFYNFKHVTFPMEKTVNQYLFANFIVKMKMYYFFILL